jgi:hypothetical protein
MQARHPSLGARTSPAAVLIKGLPHRRREH